MKKIVAILMAMLMVISVTVVLAGSAADNDTKTKEPVIIGFTGTPGHADKAMVRGHGGDIKYSYTIINAIAAKLPAPAIENIQRNPRVTYVERDVEVHTLEDTLPWGVDRIDAELVWNGAEGGCDVTPGRNAGAGAIVAIIDTGLDKDHPDLAANIAGGRNFVGWFRVDPDAWDDDNGHGTHCGGIVAAVDNEEGVIGVAPEASLYGVKVLDRRGSGYVSDIIAGIEWAVKNDADIISMSLGTTSDVQSFHDACDVAWNNGVLLVAAAGNEYGSPVIYPAAYSSVIAVSATNSDDNLAPFSSTGPEVELAAPGVDIYSTYEKGGYATKSGTSMACPHVTGTAALVIASGISGAAAVRQQLTSTAEDIGAAGWDSWYGHGLVEADEAAPSTENQPPVADANGPYSGDEGSSIEFDGSGSSDSDGTIVSYSWDFGDETSAAGETVTHAYAQEGTYTATLTVTDDDGEDGTDSAQVEVTDIDPVAALSYSPASPAAQSPVQFTDESTFYDIITSWSWDFDGDGTEDSAFQNPAHSYNSAGEYTVSLTVEEADGDSDMATQIITVSAPNQPPDANAGPDQTANEGESVNFDGSSSSDSDGTIEFYDWDFDDGTTGAGKTTAQVYADNGIYTVTLAVTDNNGAMGTDTATVTIENVAPAVVDAGSDQMVNEGATVSFSGSFTDPGSGDTHTIEWNFGDDNTASGSLTPTHVYVDDGSYIVTLTVTDDDSGLGTDTASVTVNNVAPTAEAGGPYSGIVDNQITLAGSATDPGTSDTLTYSWDFGDENSAGGQTVSHTYSATGIYTATLTVTDDDGGKNTDTATVDVTEAEVVEFYDSFEDGLGKWTQDAQNDWFVSTQRATDGTHSAEVDGRARDATLTMANAIDLSGKVSATLTFSWFIEGSWDNGEYIKLDISTDGVSSWTETDYSIDGKSRTSSGPDENKWIPVSVELSAEDRTDNFKIRFRAKVSNSREDGYVDKVKITSVK